uniref:Uncharacterized protein n=1 Tax=Panagrolaimus sp. ES5 TaxID=591445 RepID=A0AC34FY56_9BILA
MDANNQSRPTPIIYNMQAINLNTFEKNIQRFSADFSSPAQFDAFKKYFFQLLVTREDIKTTLQALASIQQLITSNDEQHEFLVDRLANAYYFVYQKKQDMELMTTRLTNAIKTRKNRILTLNQKLLDSVVKVNKVQKKLERRLKEIHKKRLEMKHKLDQMKAIIDGFEGEKPESEFEMSSLKTDLSLSHVTAESSKTSELMGKFFDVQNALEERKASYLQKRVIKEQQIYELRAVNLEIKETQKRKLETIKVIPQRNESDFTLNQSVWNF